MRTQGEIEAIICEGMARFEQEYMGRGPKDIRAHLLGDFLVVRMHGVLTPAEQKLVRTLPAEKGRDLVKQVRTHHDISTLTGEEVVFFTLATAVLAREKRLR